MRIVPIVSATALVVTAVGAALIQAPAAQAATACDVTWTASTWSTGFTAEVKLTNNAAPLTAWTLTWTFPGDQRITSAWNAGVTQSGQAVTATNVAWNGSLATGASASFGVQGTTTGTNTAPANFAVNGASCTEPAPPTTPPPSTTPPSPTTPPPTTPPPTTPPPGGAGGDSFENQAAGAPAGDWSTATPDCSGAGTATIDKTVAHTGTTSLRVNGAAGYCNHVFAANTRIIDPAATAWYVRYWVRHTTALPAAHTTAVALRDAADGNKDLRFGGQNGALQFNRASDDATLPEQSPAGVALSRPLPVNTWVCVEFSVNGADGTMQTWLDGVSVPGLRQDGVPTHDIDSQWLNRTYRPRLTDLRLGWESYGDGADTLWYDDVRVAGSRIGC
jgi:hypothetical protein